MADLFLRKVIYLLAAATSTTVLGPKEDGSKPWKDFKQQLYSAPPMVFMMNQSAKPFHGCHTIWGGFADRIFSTEPIRKVAGMRKRFSGMKRSALW